jgi:hypothetical protein
MSGVPKVFGIFEAAAFSVGPVFCATIGLFTQPVDVQGDLPLASLIPLLVFHASLPSRFAGAICPREPGELE